jgi:phenylpropionate dioxygenase-like ring-hydroxylating dioxygenase large terminal subunit
VQLNLDCITIQHQATRKLVTLLNKTTHITMSNAVTSINPVVGGNDIDRFDCREAWYPVYFVEDLDRSKPNSFTLLNQPLVIWWETKAEEWRVFEDKCPHRLAPLSEGRINEAGLLECPYHGWAFSGAGQCEVIPQQRETQKAESSPRACAKTLPAAIRQGLLFVYAGESANAEKAPIPIIEPMEEDPDGWICLNTFRDLPYDATTLMENVIDSSHVPYTHHQTIGKRSNAAPVDLEVVEYDRSGFKGIWPEGPRKGTLGKQYTSFIAPSLMWHDLTSKQFGRTLTVVYATPIRKGECRLFALFPFKFNSKLPGIFLKLTPRWYSHLNQMGILEDDQIFLYFQERYLAHKGGTENFNKAFYLPTKADLFVFQYRTWLQQYEADPFPGQEFPLLLSKEALLERYQSHTKKCACCRGALKNIQRLRLVIGIVTALLWTIVPLLTTLYQNSSLNFVISFTLLTLITGIGWLILGRLEKRFYEGLEVPPRNLSKK